jgi:hypothetical protein
LYLPANAPPIYKDNIAQIVVANMKNWDAGYGGGNFSNCNDFALDNERCFATRNNDGEENECLGITGSYCPMVQNNGVLYCGSDGWCLNSDNSSNGPDFIAGMCEGDHNATGIGAVYDGNNKLLGFNMYFCEFGICQCF